MAELNLADHLDLFEPQSLLECSAMPWHRLRDYCGQRQIEYRATTPEDLLQAQAGADLAVVHDALETLEAARSRVLLGHLRNSVARRIWLLVRADADWPLAELIALGFRRYSPASTDEWHSYTYDINTYNHKRSWNNPDYWANPENFHKYRW